ncbi:MAG TPA: FYDLN acid domain-containing protein, partial [Dongiaceae bacterium]
MTGVVTLASPAWGMKRSCQSCGTRFYDLNHSTIACPKCGTVYDPESGSRT